MLKKVGIFRKTFLFTALLILLVTLVSVGILYFAMPSFYLYKKEQSVMSGMEDLEKALKEAPNQDACAVLIANFAEEYNVTVTSIDMQGITILPLSSPFVSLKNREGENDFLIVSNEYTEEELLTSITQLYQSLIVDNNPEAGGLLDLETYILYDTVNAMFFEAQIGSEIIDQIQIQGTLQPIDEARGVIFSLIPYVLAAGCTIGLCLAWIYSRQITRPILKLSATAVRMKNMEYDGTVEIETNDEWGVLSENLIALYQSLSKTIADLKFEMDKVSRLEQSKTEMMQSASHELKTPIAALSGMLDGMIDNIGVYKDKDTYLLKCKEQVEKLALLVKEILEASRTDRREQGIKLVELEIDEMTKKIIKEYEPLISEKQLKMKTEIDKVILRTDAAVLYSAITNLIGNAVLYSPPSGEVHIALSSEWLVIENQCGEIPEAEMKKLFEPFYTRSSSRDRMVSGTGLGLYIVKRNLERLSIPYRAESLESGFRITLSFV